MKSRLLLVTAFLLLLIPSADARSFREKLLAIDGVISVEEIEQEEKVFAEKYLVTIEQPVNWADPQSEMFPQRFEIGYQSDDSPNVFYLSGYMLNDGRFKQDDRPELAKIYNTNYIRCEYRFYSKSAPEDLSYDDTKYWLYLNEKNAAQDFHRIIDELKDILAGRWIFTGASKGGEATTAFATYYPHDADVYVPSVAPFADESTGVFTRNLYKTIGDERYGSELAAKYRSELLEFQVEAVKNRSYMQDVFWRDVESGDVKVRPFVTKEIMFDMIILEFTVTTWQYNQNFEAIEKVLAMPREDDPSTETDEKRAYDLAGNTNVKIIADPKQSHSFKIANLPEEMRDEIIAIIDEAILDDIDDSGVNSKSSGGCNLTGVGVFLVMIAVILPMKRSFSRI